MRLPFSEAGFNLATNDTGIRAGPGLHGSYRAQGRKSHLTQEAGRTQGQCQEAKTRTQDQSGSRQMILDHCIPANFTKIGRFDFELFLLACPDYYRHSYSSGTLYYFRHNKYLFAVVKTEPDQVYMDHSLLQTPQ